MKSTWVNGRCYYKDDSGNSLPAVSTVLKKTQAEDSIAALAWWRKKNGELESNRITAVRRRTGTALHQMVKGHLHGHSPMSCSELIQPYWDSVQSVLGQISNIQLVEAVVWNYVERYAGKVDLVACYQGTPCMIELTTADKPKLLASNLYDKPVQLVAYGGAVNRCYSNSLYGSKIDHALVIVALPGGPAEIFWFDREQVLWYWDRWQDRLKLFYEGEGEQSSVAS